MTPRENDSEPIVCLVSLGCAKNTVDSECLLGQLASAGLLLAEDPADADVCLVNTCGFIQEARAETAATLEELAELKTGGRLKALVALGCLVERAADLPEMAAFLRHADARIGFAEYPRLPDICRKLGRGTIRTPLHRGPTAGREGVRRPGDAFMRFLASPRARIGSPHTAYLKISEGCSNRCRFCAIPDIRGSQISRPLDDLLAEARSLVGAGAREINLIAQDTTSYGVDRPDSARLPTLLSRLQDIDPSAWFRMLYAHPRHLGADILELLSSRPHLCPYLDLPLQHIADPILDAMGRGISRKETIDLLDRIHRILPQGAIRTTFIVGYPGETDRQFEELLDFVREGRFTHVGAFEYSSEPGTPAARLNDDVPAPVKAERRAALMLAQLDVSRAHQAKRVGRRIEVMLDGLVTEGDDVPEDVLAYGRTRLEAPDVDGLIFLRGTGLESLAPGMRVNARVVEALDYDVIADVTAGS